MKKEEYLKKFKMQNNVSEFGFSEEVESAGNSVVDELKKRELTYEEAYASLEWAYNKLRYESNFLKLL